MRTADSSDFWFAAVLLVSFGLLAVIFFGRAVTDVNFWTSLMSIIPAVLIASYMRDPIAKTGRLPRFIAWFALGVTAGVFVALVGGRDFGLIDFIWFGIVLAVIDFIAERFFSKQELE